MQNDTKCGKYIVLPYDSDDYLQSETKFYVQRHQHTWMVRMLIILAEN